MGEPSGAAHPAIRVGEHLEVARVGETIRVRDLRDPGDPFVYTLTEWRAFCAGAKAGEFDHLLAGRHRS